VPPEWGTPGMLFNAEAQRTQRKRREEQEGQNRRDRRRKSQGWCYYDGRMSDLSRIGVAIDSVLLEKFDKLIGRRGYTNRSEAFRDLIREELVEEAWESPAAQVVGTVTLVYDHHVRLLSEKLTAIQHDYHHSILSTLHVHLDHDHCLEVLVVRGKSAVVRKVADTLISVKGVKHGRLTITTTGKELK
jgi:CopG family nickel-responsive transcriptional regulator